MKIIDILVMKQRDNSHKNYILLLWKELHNSDVSNTGRIVLPKIKSANTSFNFLFIFLLSKLLESVIAMPMPRKMQRHIFLDWN
jgi:hypothetical protein